MEAIIKHADLIYDVGMCTGEDTDYYLKKGFQVVAFEADPELARQCRERFAAEIDSKKLTIVEGAILDRSSSLIGSNKTKFYKNVKKSNWGTVEVDWARRAERLRVPTEVIEVDSIDFKQCIRRFGIPHYMKIDIEGADIICVKALLDFEFKPDYISIESEKLVFGKLQQEIDLLTQLGYSQFKAIQQATLPGLSSPNPSREGKAVAYQFPYGSSGPFGEDLTGDWRTKSAIIKDYEHIFVTYRLFGDFSPLRRFSWGGELLWHLGKLLSTPLPGWYDTHAKHSSISA